MAKEIEEMKTTSNSNETGPGTNNNLYQKGFEKSQSYDERSDGMGIERPATLKSFEDVPGTLADERESLLNREVARFNDLKSKAFGRNIPITNEGIVLDAFGGGFGEQRGTKGDGIGEQKGN